MLAVWESPADAKLPERMDKTFRKQSEKAQKLMAGNGICRKMNLIDIELNPGETGRKKEFIRRNDGGREWRETTIKAGVLRKIRRSGFGQDHQKNILSGWYSDIASEQTYRELQESKAKKNTTRKQKRYLFLPAAPKSASIPSIRHVRTAGGRMVSRFFDWQTERFDFKGNQRDTKPEYIAVATAAVFVIALLLFRIMNGWIRTSCPYSAFVGEHFFVLTAFFLFF